MHLADGLVPAPLCLGGYGLTGFFTWYSLHRIHQDDRRSPNGTRIPVATQVPKASLLTAAFFVASLINIPIPPASVHLVLNGLLGVVLGYFAFPAILIGLILQAIVFGHGGFTTLGVNAAMMGIPAILSHGIFQQRHLTQTLLPCPWSTGLWGGLAGAVGLGLATLVFVGSTLISIPTAMGGEISLQEHHAILILALAHIPLMIIEGIFTGFLVVFLERVKPELLIYPLRIPSRIPSSRLDSDERLDPS